MFWISATHSKRTPGLGFKTLALMLAAAGFFSASCRTPGQDAAQDTPPGIAATAILPTATPAPLATAEILHSPFYAWISPSLPAAARDQIAAIPDLVFTSEPDQALILFHGGEGEAIGEWIYLAVTPFRSFQTGVSSQDLISRWAGSGPTASDSDQIFLSEETYQALSLLWGEPSGGGFIIIAPDLLLAEIWNDPDALAIIPFQELSPDWKVLPVDGQDPLGVEFEPAAYPLSVHINAELKDISFSSLQLESRVSNFNPDRLTSVALTGVTALVRDTAAIMEEKGITYPAIDVKDLLVNADITHISNEVPFAEDCPAPDSNQESLYFCSRDSYIELLEDVGTDIVELSGDHFGDWGPEAMLHSLDLYWSRGWLTYGGGRTLQEGLEPVFIDHNGNSFAFIGCNGKVHDRYATASATNPGASRCDFEYMIPEITRLSDQGYIVIATMQHEEIDSFNPVAIQLYDFRRLAEAGADIVSGSQAHHPQSFEFTGSSFIHYGLGNLFFDQWYLATYNPSQHANKDKAFIDLHYFYNGSYINTRLVSLQFIDNARPRFMDAEESQSFLSDVYLDSLWRGDPLIPYPW